jgi:predicted PurR-regulated permease PerM
MNTPFSDHDKFLAPRLEEHPMVFQSNMARDLRIIRTCIIGLTTIAFLTIGVAAADLLAPTAVALVLALILAPLNRALEKIGIPSGAASIIVVVTAISALAYGIVMFAPGVSHLIKEGPSIVQSVEKKLQPIRNQLNAFESASQQISQATSPAPKNAPVVSVVDGNNDMLFSVASTAPAVLAKLVYVTVLTIFLLALRRYYTNQLILLPRRQFNRVRMARICRDVKSRVSGYLFTLAMINIGLAIATAVCFKIAGIPQGIFWGVAYGVLNFIPIIGPTTIIGASALVGLAFAPTIWGAILPPLILLALDTVEAYFVQPWLLSRRLVVSPVAIFVMVATLVWMWGAYAAITAVPILILIHTISVHVPSMKPFAMLLATEHHSGRKGALRRRGLYGAQNV